MPAVDIEGTIRRYYSAYETKSRQVLEELLSADFVFTSPRDDHISRAAYFDRCWPNSEKIRSFTIEKLFVQDTEAFVRYILTPHAGDRFRNTEFFRFDGNKITNIDVYFGRTL